MKPFIEQMRAYNDYHQNPSNHLTHFIGVPLIILSFMIAAGWIHIVIPNYLETNLAWVLSIVVAIYYCRLHLLLGLSVSVVLVLLNLLALLFSQPAPNSFGFWAFVISFVIGAIFQIVGHIIEGKRPAFVDNLAQSLIAPVYLMALVYFYFGYFGKLKAQLFDNP